MPIVDFYISRLRNLLADAIHSKKATAGNINCGLVVSVNISLTIARRFHYVDLHKDHEKSPALMKRC
jgi:hypothetical protein